MRIALLALEGSLASGITGLSDFFWITNQAISALPVDSAQLPPVTFDTFIISPEGKTVRDIKGHPIRTDLVIDFSHKFDAVMVTGMELNANHTPKHMSSVSESKEWLRFQYENGAIIAGVCGGNFVLAEAGLLNGRQYTTTWWLHHIFQERYPHSRPVWGKPLVEDERIITSSGPLSWPALALHIIKKMAGPKVANLAADMAMADSQPLSQQVYAPPGFINNRHPLLMRAEEIIRYSDPSVNAEGLAAALNTTERTLQRRLKTLTNETPKSFITRVRIELACVLLADPRITVELVASKSGFKETSSFRRAFIQTMGITPAEYRKRINGRSDK